MCTKNSKSCSFRNYQSLLIIKGIIRCKWLYPSIRFWETKYLCLIKSKFTILYAYKDSFEELELGDFHKTIVLLSFKTLSTEFWKSTEFDQWFDKDCFLK